MRTYGRKDLSWKNNKLYLGGEVLVELIPHKIYENHWHLKFNWRDAQTPEFFNIINARENSLNITVHHLNSNAQGKL